MQFIRSYIEYMPQQGYDIGSIYKQIEMAGRTCYKSEDKMTDTSAKKFVEMLKTNCHGAMLEHGTIYLKFNLHDKKSESYFYLFTKNPYSRVDCDNEHDIAYVTTNYRVLVENGYLDALDYICEPNEFHERRYTFKFICDRGVSAEFNRHRVNSMGEQSTRYCNYSKNKFGNQLSIIIPDEIDDINEVRWNDDTNLLRFRNMCDAIAVNKTDDFNIIDTWLFANFASQWSYMKLIELGWKPQQARRILPLDLKTELVHTAFISDWKHFLSLRSPKYGAKGVHPDAARLGDMLYDKLVELKAL